MRKTLLVCFGCLWSIMGPAQSNDGKTFKEVPPLSGIFATNPDLLKDYAIMQEKANQGDIHSLLFLGHMHLVGMGTEVNEGLAFQYYMKAAQQGNIAAEYHIGNAYMKGAGCEVDFDKALNWLTLSAEHGNEHANYAIGYNYLKGLGVPQDYQKAMEWFESTPYPMAKYWLGNCYYFGYGVAKDTEKAKAYYQESQDQIVGSKMMLKHIANNIKETVDATINKELTEKDSLDNTGIGRETIEKFTVKTHSGKKSKALKPKKLNGNWKGKLITLDWSGKQITQITPLSCELAAQDGNVNYLWKINGTTNEATALWVDNALYFDELILGLDWPFSDTYMPIKYWKLLSAQLELRGVNNKTYLVGHLETYDPINREPGPPMRIILKQTRTGEVEELTEEELLSISQQDPHFITLYPNPFANNVLIAYKLDTDAQVSVTVHDIYGTPVPIAPEAGTWQTAGKHQYTLYGDNLKKGMYIVRVTVGNQVHSRILIKQ